MNWVLPKNILKKFNCFTMDASIFDKKLLVNIIALSLALAVASFLPYAWIAFAAVIIVFLFFYYKQDFVLVAVIMAYLVITGDEAEKIRNALNIIALGILVLLSLSKFGFKFKNYPKVPGEIIKFISFLFFTLFVSSVFSKDPFAGFASMARMAVFLFICYFFYSFIENRKTINLFVLAIFFSVSILGGSIFISLAKSGFSLLMLQGNLARFAGFYENPNYAGLLLVISVPLIISFFFAPSFQDKGKRFLLISFLLLNILILLLADSRASLLSIVLSSAIIIFLMNRSLFIKIFISSLVILIILFLIPDVQDFLLLYLRLDRINNRDYFWNTGIDIIKAYPVFGVGPDMFQKYFFTYMPSAVTRYYSSGAWIVGKPHPHNFFLFFTAENGVLGFITAVYFWVLFFYIGIKDINLTRLGNKNYFILCVAVTAIGAGVFVRSFFEITGYLTYGFITRDLTFWLMFVVLIYIYQKFKIEVLQKPG